MSSLEALRPAPDDGPPPITEQEYISRATARYHEVLAGATHEKELQAFFEEHPPLLPGAFLGFVGHGAYLNAVVAQPDLQGLGSRQPDFMWISRNSGMLRPVLVEIERPTKQWVTTGKNPQPTADLTQALNQFRQWREWFDRPENRLLFLAQYGMPQEWTARRFSPIYLLIYGRRDENVDEIGRIRAAFQQEDQHLITYDHVQPSRRQLGYFSVKREGVGTFRALHMPASSEMGPNDPESWLKVGGREEMVERNPWISEERKRYLIEDRIPKWDDWAKNYYARQDEFFKSPPAQSA